MKGIIFNIFEAFVCQHFGENAYEVLLDSCLLQTREPFIGPGTYADADLIEFITKASLQFNIPTPELLRTFGRFVLPRFAKKMPTLLENHTAKSFLLSVQDIVHVEVHKLYPEAVTPVFHYEDPASNRLLIHYHSPRCLCHLMEGLLDGVGHHFSTNIEQSQLQCMHDGADSCIFDLVFSPLPRSQS